MRMNLSPFSLLREVKGETSLGTPPSVELVNKFYSMMAQILLVYERQWYLNIANLMGNQWLVYNSTGRRFEQPPAPSWRVRLTINKILPIARIQMAKLSEINPRFYVASETSEGQDMAGAQVSTKVVENIYNSQVFSEIVENIISWVVTTGNYYVFPLYDSEAGRRIVEREIVPVVDPQTGAPFINPDGTPMVEEKEKVFYTGDIYFDETDPFEVIPDFSTSKWGEMSGLIKRKLRSVEYVQEKYGVKVDPEPFDLTFNSPIKSMSQSTSGGGGSDIRKTLRHAVIVKDYYEAPSAQAPEGRHLIVANNKELFVDKLKRRIHGRLEIPCVHFGGIKIPKRLLYMSPIENLLPLQWQYNRGRSQIIEDINLISRPKYMVPLDSISDDAITDQPGEVVMYDPASGDKPGILQGAQTIDQGRMDNLNRLDEEMKDIGGVHDISQGRLPRRATSGFALVTLDEKDTTVLAPMKKNMRSGLEKVFSFALTIAQEEFKESRVLKILGKRDSIEHLKFTASDLGSSDDVRVMIDEPFPQSRAAKLEFAVSLVKVGMLSAQSARKILGLDGMTGVENALDEEMMRIAAEAQAMAVQKPQPKPSKSK